MANQPGCGSTAGASTLDRLVFAFDGGTNFDPARTLTSTPGYWRGTTSPSTPPGPSTPAARRRAGTGSCSPQEEHCGADPASRSLVPLVPVAPEPLSAGLPTPRWPPPMPVPSSPGTRRRGQERALGESPTEELQRDRQAILSEAHGHRDRRRPARLPAGIMAAGRGASGAGSGAGAAPGAGHRSRDRWAGRAAHAWERRSAS